MGFEKQIALALLVVVFVASSSASPTAQSEPTWVDSGYVESGQCKVSRSSAKLSIIISIDLYNNVTILCYFFRSPMSAHTNSLLLSSSFKETYFRTTHYLPRSELIATPVNSALILDCIYRYICRGVTSFQWCKIVIRLIDLTLTDATKRKYISAQRCGYMLAIEYAQHSAHSNFYDYTQNSHNVIVIRTAVDRPSLQL